MHSVIISLNCDISLNALIWLHWRKCRFSTMILVFSFIFFCCCWMCRCVLIETYHMMTWQCRMYAAQGTSHFLTSVCVYLMHLCVQSPWRHFRSDKRPETMLSDRKRKLNRRCSCTNQVISVKGRRRSLSLPFLPFLRPSVTLADSLWSY